MSKTNDKPGPLSPALVCLLQTCLDAHTMTDKELAKRLCLSPETVHTEFKRIAQVLGTHDRFEAILFAWDKGWITYSPPPRRMKPGTQTHRSPCCEKCPQLGYCAFASIVLQ